MMEAGSKPLGRFAAPQRRKLCQQFLALVRQDLEIRGSRST